MNVQQIVDRETLIRWANMTDLNDHKEVRLEIAQYFNLPIYVAYYKLLLAYIETNKSLPQQLITDYCKVTDLMLRDIKLLYGEEVSNKVKDCL